MGQFQHSCPHCATVSAGFSVKYQWPSRTNGNEGSILAICGVCDRGMVAHVRATGWSSFPDFVSAQYEVGSNSYPILQTWPSTPRIIPPDVPDTVGRFYEQGVKSLLAANWDAAGSMFRKTLDVATKLLRPDLKAKSLFERINQMVADHDLTPAMGDWSHRIRLDGNNAVHDEDPETKEDAASTREFTEAFLTYAYSLPASVAKHTQPPANDVAAVA